MVLLNKPASQAYSSIRVATSSDPNAIGLDVRWDLDSTTRPNVKNGKIQYLIGAQGTSDAPNFTGSFDEFEAIQRSFNTWRNLPRSELDFEFAGTVDAPIDDGNDNLNQVFWDTQGFSPGTFAITVTTFDNQSGEILDADLIFNQADFVWDTLSEGATSGTVGRASIENIAVHEIGHILGLDHSFTNASSMFPFTDSGAINLTTLEHDDAAQLHVDHPNPEAPASSFATIEGTITSGGTGRFGVVISLIDMATGNSVMHSLSERDTSQTTVGEYRIVDIPPGNYWVMASKLETGNMGSYYSSAFTSFLPAARGVAAGTLAQPSVLAVKPNDALTGIDLQIANATNPFEPNDVAGTATALTLGQAAGARIEGSSDVDFYSFAANAGEKFRFQVYADAFGSPLNPEITLFDTDGITKLITGEFGDPAFDQNARDIQPDAFALETVNFDAFLTFTPGLTGTYFLSIEGTGTSSGDYIVTSFSDSTFNTLDTNASTIEADAPGGLIGGSDLTITVTPRNSLGEAFPASTSFNVELLDLGAGGTVADTINGTGPYEFTIAPPATPGLLEYGVRIDGATLEGTLSLPFTQGSSTASSSNSSLRILTTSLVADGSDSTTVEIFLRDGNDLLITEPALNTLLLTTSTGSLTTSTANGTSLEPEYDPATGSWKAELQAPSTGTGISLSVELASSPLLSKSLPLTQKAQTGSPATNPGTGSSKKKDDGGCSINQSSTTWPLPFFLLLIIFSAMLSHRLIPHLSHRS